MILPPVGNAANPGIVIRFPMGSLASWVCRRFALFLSDAADAGPGLD
jgi:hypothetical protein